MAKVMHMPGVAEIKKKVGMNTSKVEIFTALSTELVSPTAKLPINGLYLAELSVNSTPYRGE